MPNMPTTTRPCTRFAPATLRERNRRSGISGFATRAWRATKAATQRERDRAEDERGGRAPALLGDLQDRVDAEHQAAGEQRRAGEVGAGAEADALGRLDVAQRQQRRSRCRSAG